MRELTSVEKSRIRIFTQNSISITLLEPTENGLKKSIMDATGPVRNYLKNNGIHDFDTQSQGPINKVIIPTQIYTDFKIKNTKTSLYRPITKQGDPRIWIYGLKSFVDPNDIIGIIVYENQLNILNLTKLDLENLVSSPLLNPIQELIREINQLENVIADELLGMLKGLAKRGPIASLLQADTSIGRTLETELGIAMNSSKQPDYKGIELKSYRSMRSSGKKVNNRKTLFAQVPNWKLSNLKSSREILENFGYERENEFKLYCTVSTLRPNSQGLKLELKSNISQLIEGHNSYGEVVVWETSKLHSRLLKKHNETFWVAAESIKEDNKEYFQFRRVYHTRKPITSQFDILLEQGKITLDHLIKRNTKGRVKEKGPFFKIDSDSLELLFPPSKIYNLLD
ncbi:MvaI/BcnI family restriction endonuclease [Gramella lutea]|uniref:MvaI/BcnI family restriction endonuclease n=1 Tax=Christiangramia lutea TaxID=1607951 RepID=A0A9X2AC34_9FLAO|nr:MvaI/BcnI family restriction endonuclease [Christiangramia lutea]MCH4823693.1 MvaI/BcnI family restriction endonuclease [Christiangramia lutea]